MQGGLADGAAGGQAVRGVVGEDRNWATDYKDFADLKQQSVKSGLIRGCFFAAGDGAPIPAVEMK